jgi:hypothetical protein
MNESYCERTPLRRSAASRIPRWGFAIQKSVALIFFLFTTAVATLMYAESHFAGYILISGLGAFSVLLFSIQAAETKDLRRDIAFLRSELEQMAKNARER